MASDAKMVKLSEEDRIKNSELEIIEQIDRIQNDLDKLNDEASNEIVEIERLFNRKRQPLQQSRAALIENIPNFWYTVLKNHPQISAYISPFDEHIIKHLTCLNVLEFDDIKSGYHISMTFSQNEYFTNKTITRVFHLGESECYSKTTESVQWINDKSISDALINSAGYSLIYWLVGDTDYCEELSNVIKDDIWPNPLQYYMLGEDEKGDTKEAELTENAQSLGSVDTSEEEMAKNDDGVVGSIQNGI